jgi:DNA replication licensing factor MCM4
MMSNF